MKTDASETKVSTYNGMSFAETSLAVVACDGNGHGCILWARGAHIQVELEEHGLRGLGDLGLDDAPVGVSVWEGTYVWVPTNWEYPNEGDMLPKGTFRSPTDTEWQAIRGGRSPWG